MRVLAIGLAASLTFSLVMFTWWVAEDSRSVTVDAEVVDIITNSPGRRFYEVRFVTPEGYTCVAEVDSGSNPPVRAIHLGGRSSVQYPVSDPCGRVRESGGVGGWTHVITLGLAVVASLVWVWRLRPAAFSPAE